MKFLPSLLPRPPTPPKDADHDSQIQDALLDAESFLESSGVDDLQSIKSTKTLKAVSISSSLQTPPQSSPVSSPGPTKAAKSKQLRFDLQISFCDGSQSKEPNSAKTAPSIQPRSILKPFDASPPSLNHFAVESPVVPASPQSIPFSEMLHSVVQQLSGEQLDSRKEGYRILAGCIQAFDNEPDRSLLIEKIPFLEQCMQQDMAVEQLVAGPQETQLMFHALRLARILLWDDTVASTLSIEFKQTIVEDCIRMMERRATPKQIATHQVHLLTAPQLYPRAVNGERVHRIIAGLADIQSWVSGNGILISRLSIYRRLINHKPQAMLSKADQWLQQIIHAMLSNVGEVRTRAVNVGLFAGEKLGSSVRMSNITLNMFEEQISDTTSYFDEFESRIIVMLQSKDQNLIVPHIWSVIILLLRGRPQNIQRWTRLVRWLKVISKCFNSSSAKLNIEAFAAWNRWIFSLELNADTRSSIVQNLRLPIVTRFERRGQSTQVKDAARSTHLLLLYYVFRPCQATDDQVAMYWEECVDKVFRPMIQADAGEDRSICRVLNALLGDSSLKVWNGNRAIETPMSPVKPEELPRLEAKWIRKNISKILNLIQPLILRQIWSTSSDVQPMLSTLWTTLAKAITDAGSKEIKTSADHKNAVVAIINLIHVIFKGPAPSTKNELFDCANFAHKFRPFFKTAVEMLGSTVRTEKNVDVNNNDGAFEFASSSSERKSVASRSMEYPDTALMCLICSCPEWMSVSEWNLNWKQHVFDFLDKTSSRTIELNILMSFVKRMAPALTNSATNDTASVIWQDLVQRTAKSLEIGYTSRDQTFQQDALDLATCVDIFSKGLCANLASLLHSSASFQSIMNMTQLTFGDAGLLRIVILPVLKAIESNDVEKCLAQSVQVVTWILACLPNAQSETLDTEKTIENFADIELATLATGSPDILIWTMVSKLLHKSYLHLTRVAQPFAQFMETLILHLQHDVPSRTCFAMIERGLRPLIEDRDDMISSLHDAANVKELLHTLWETYLVSIDFEQSSSITLQEHCNIITSALCSRDITIASMTINWWNDTLGDQDSFQYPEQSIPILNRLRSLTDLCLPSFPLDEYLEKSEESDMDRFLWLKTWNPTEDGDKIILNTHSQIRRHEKTPDRSITPRNRKYKSKSRSQSCKSTTPMRSDHNDTQFDITIVSSRSPICEDSLPLIYDQERLELQQSTTPIDNLNSKPSPASSRRRNNAVNSAPRALQPLISENRDKTGSSPLSYYSSFDSEKGVEDQSPLLRIKNVVSRPATGGITIPYTDKPYGVAASGEISDSFENRIMRSSENLKTSTPVVRLAKSHEDKQDISEFLASESFLVKSTPVVQVTGKTRASSDLSQPSTNSSRATTKRVKDSFPTVETGSGESQQASQLLVMEANLNDNRQQEQIDNCVDDKTDTSKGTPAVARIETRKRKASQKEETTRSPKKLMVLRSSNQQELESNVRVQHNKLDRKMRKSHGTQNSSSSPAMSLDEPVSRTMTRKRSFEESQNSAPTTLLQQKTQEPKESPENRPSKKPKRQSQKSIEPQEQLQVPPRRSSNLKVSLGRTKSTETPGRKTRSRSNRARSSSGSNDSLSDPPQKIKDRESRKANAEELEHIEQQSNAEAHAETLDDVPDCLSPEIQPGTPDDEKIGSESQSSQSSSIASPVVDLARGIINRLRGIIPDLRSLIVRSHDETHMELEDLGLEIQREITAVGRRSRQTTGNDI